ncbi:MAG: hypothetical protein ACLQUY_05250 [Ktedonobacterales bacterium]
MHNRAKPYHQPPAGYTEDAESVIARLSVQNKPVSRTQLARWHRAGLVPKPVPVSQGRGRGTISFYPTGTRRQLEVLCTFLSQDRDLDRVGWKLWWEGYPVSMAFVHSVLQASAHGWIEFLAAVLPPQQADGDDLSDAAWELIERSSNLSRREHGLGRVGTRVGRKNVPTVLQVVFLVVGGIFFEYPDERHADAGERQQTIIDRALGLGSRALRDLPETVEVSHEIPVSAAGLSELFSQTDPLTLLQDATDADLVQARDVAQRWWRRLQQIVRALSRNSEVEMARAGVKAPLRRILRGLIHQLNLLVQELAQLSNEDQAMLLLIVLGRAEWSPNLVRQVLATLPADWQVAAVAALLQAQQEQTP